MSKADPEPQSLELPPLEDVEHALDLEAEDRQDIPGLYNLNVGRVPTHRVIGMQLLLAFAVLHNLLVLPEPGWQQLVMAGLVIELYAGAQYVVLRSLFTRSRLHLGTVFLVADLAIFTLVIWATGATRSWLWPLYLVRVADQMWIGRKRAAVMAALAAGFYGALLALVALQGGEGVAWTLEILKVMIFGGLSTYLVSTAGLPWNVQEKAHAAKDLILRLEEQSIELDEARYRAELASRAKSTFLARMSHELRTPLNSVVGFTNVLLKKGESLGERDLDYLKRIRQNGMHLLALINDVLDIARIEEGKVDIKLGPLDLEELVRDTVHQLEGRRLESGVRVSVSFPRELQPLVADEARLRQVLINLVGNALKFTSEGFVRVDVDADADGTATAIHVVDSGVGIAPERLDGIFDAFEQEDGSTARRFGGTGLGLAISRSLCRLMGFELLVESAVNEGSRFTVELKPQPQRLLHADRAPAPAREPAPVE